MTGLMIFSLALTAGLSQLSLVTAGGNGSMHRYFCKPPGCAANVTTVYCNNKKVWNDKIIKDCLGLPPSNTVCQHNGRAFVTTDTDGRCEFEGHGYYIETEICEANNTICALDQTPPSTSNHDAAFIGELVGGLVGGVLLLLVLLLTLYFKTNICKRRQSQQDIQLNNQEGCETQNGALLNPESVNVTVTP